MNTIRLFSWPPVPIIKALADGWCLVRDSNGPMIAHEGNQFVAILEAESEDIPPTIRRKAIGAYVEFAETALQPKP